MEDYTIVQCYKYDGQYFESMDALNTYKESLFDKAIEEFLFHEDYYNELAITISDLIRLCKIDSEALLKYLKNRD